LNGLKDELVQLIYAYNYLIDVFLFSPIGKLADRAIYFAFVKFFFTLSQIIPGST